jgi:alkanesulfonate monooxygenase SsuD/methylene tetrahydromethanopterin reductase-like flavin-dependent oxidoreductase (luciferase family)
MKLGICSLWGDDLAAFRNEIGTAARLGYELITVGDSPAGWHEMVAALECPDAIIAPMVTSPFMRHPLVLASAMTSLDNLSGGRAALGLATGGSTILAIGRPPATQTEIRAEFAVLHDLFAGRPSTCDGRAVKPLRFARKIPIYYSAFGPKALALAGEQADGVIVFTGGKELDQLGPKIEAVRAAARAAGRDPAAIDVWAISYTAVRPTYEAAINDLLAFIAVNAMAMRTPEALAMIPGQFRAKVDEFQRRYDPTEHVVVGGKNVRLMQELGLTEFLSDFNTTAGSAQDVAQVLRECKALGVSTFIAALPGHADPLATIHGLHAARALMQG